MLELGVEFVDYAAEELDLVFVGVCVLFGNGFAVLGTQFGI